jgi:hypothetical protein
MWIILTPDLLVSRVAGAEKSALDRAATDPMQMDALGDVARQVAAEWRGLLRRIVTVDRRPLAVPSELEDHVLADFRFRAYTRLPGMSSLNDERRMEEWRLSNRGKYERLSSYSLEPPEEENLPDPAPPANVPMITVPQRFFD